MKKFTLIRAAHIHAIFQQWQSANPHPTTELIYHNPFQLLIAVVLSAQATDKSVNKATAKIFPHLQTPQALIAWGEDNFRSAIESIGLFRTKAKNCLALAQALIDHHHGKVPRDRAALLALPGVGIKTANVVLNTLYGDPVIAVDTHVFRVSRRLGLADGKNAEAVGEQLSARIPPSFRQHAHHWLILHGRYTCTARHPHCSTCGVAQYCPQNEP